MLIFPELSLSGLVFVAAVMLLGFAVWRFKNSDKQGETFHRGSGTAT